MSEEKKVYEMSITGYWSMDTTFEVEPGEDPYDVAHDIAMTEVPSDVEIDSIEVY
ncbi:hypothetical protein LAU42_09050 [Macrococcus armenti]|uniref:hypothetical protein n=1 Tax=Macrococcus armenti TaxID=2875764 RepID=UPI001CCB923A|nr:hypothetical protein [Macrococcus armenti]UBH21911.1 hypothetical protein LAU42_09050 [Macrococcus armenti]